MKFFGLDTTKSYTDEELEAWQLKMNRILDGMLTWTFIICGLAVIITFIYKSLK